MRRKRSGLTMIEILVVVGIIALLVGLLLPAVHTVQKMAKDTKQKAQFTGIGLGLAAFKNDYGDYPPSSWKDPAAAGAPSDYCGAQKLAEALLGWDLLGFHPDSTWRADGLAVDGSGNPVPNTLYHAPGSLQMRKDRYLELDMANAFRLGPGIWGDGLYLDTGYLAPQTFVLCDVFGTNERKILRDNGRTVPAGMPILYYKANPASKLFPDPVAGPVVDGPPPQPTLKDYVYDARDNWPLLALGRPLGLGKTFIAGRDAHPLEGRTDRPLVDMVNGRPNSFIGWNSFYWYAHDSRLSPRYWACRPDSYLLISAGADGLYGTEDDIRNFGQ